jgi:hypothetical protein
MNLSMEINIKFDTIEEAGNVGRSLRVDDDDFVETRIEGDTVTAVIRGSTIEGLRRAGDDWMACLTAILNAEKN